MPSFDDFELRPGNRPHRITFDEPPSRRPLLSLVALALVALGLAGGWVWYRSARTVAPVAAVTPASAAAASAEAHKPLGGEAGGVEVPPLDESDAFVRPLVQALSANPRVAAWLTTDGLIRNFTVVVDNIAGGATPAKHLGVLKPGGHFAVAGQPGDLRIDPASYARYDNLAAAVASVDPQAAANLYATLKPRIEEAHRDLGETTPFDAALEEAIVRLVQTPLGTDTRVAPKGAEAYQYVDVGAEALSDPQKLLLRMGPGNARIVQDRLRQIGLALGIPASRLGV